MTKEMKLLKAAMDGNTAAFEQIVKKYQSLVCAITFSGTGRVDISEELAQETFLSAWKNLRQLTDPSGFRPWLCTIARNMLNTYYRKKKTIPLDPAHLADLSDQTPTPSDNLITQEEHVMLEQAIMQIPAKYREPLVMYYRQQKSIREVAVCLELNESAIQTRLHRARQMLREEIATRLERTLERTAPDKTFTKAVMAGIGAGLAAGAVGTASAAVAATGAAGVGTGTSTGIAAVMSTVTAKIITAAAVVAVIVGGVFTYKHLSQPDSQQTQPDEIAVVSVEKESVGPSEESTLNAVVAEHTEDELTNNKTTQIGLSEQKNEFETQDAAMVSSRHPDWPGLDEPVEYIYSNLLGQDEMWVHLPRRFRKEDVQLILIDNAKDRIEVNKNDNTVQYSDSLTAGETPLYKIDQPLIDKRPVEICFLFRNLAGGVADPTLEHEYTVEKIGQEENGMVLVYKLVSKALENPNYALFANVDAVTKLPEKVVMMNNDPNSEMSGQIMDEAVFDFAAIPDSIFEYTVKTDEVLLTRKEDPCFRGMVVDMSGQPVADANVFVNYFPLYGQKYLTGKSDSEGQFEVKISPKPHEIPVNLPVFYWAVCPNELDIVAWTILQHEGDFSFEDMNDVMIGYGGNIVQAQRQMESVTQTKNGVTTTYERPGRVLKDPVINDIQLVMEPAGIIAGIVTDKVGNPIPQAQLSADFQMGHSNYYSPNLGWKFTTVSDANGHYEFHGLPALWKNCKYFMTFSANGYVTERKYITLQETLDYLEFNISLQSQLVTIRGILKDNYGTALANRGISVSAPNMSIRDCSTQTDPNGCFVLEGCPDVDGLKVVSSLSMGLPEGYPATTREKLDSFLFYPNVSQEISHVAGKKEYFVELTAIRPEMTLEVLVTDSAGNPLPEFTVGVDGVICNYDDLDGSKIPVWWRQAKLEKRTDKNGRIFFDNIPDLKEMTILANPGMTIVQELHTLNGLDEAKRKERQRLWKLGEKYKEVYEQMEIPVELVEGQTDYYIEAVVLTKDEYNSLPEEIQ